MYLLRRFLVLRPLILLAFESHSVVPLTKSSLSDLDQAAALETSVIALICSWRESFGVLSVGNTNHEF